MTENLTCLGNSNLRLDVSVENPISVHVLDGFHQLEEVVFHFVFGQVALSALDRFVEVHFHDLKHEGQSACRLIVQNLDQLNDVGVGRKSLQRFDLPKVLDLRSVGSEKCVGLALTFSIVSKCDFMHLIATFCLVFTDSAFNTSEKVPSPSLRTNLYSTANYYNTGFTNAKRTKLRGD